MVVAGALVGAAAAVLVRGDAVAAVVVAPVGAAAVRVKLQQTEVTLNSCYTCMAWFAVAGILVAYRTSSKRHS